MRHYKRVLHELTTLQGPSNMFPGGLGNARRALQEADDIIEGLLNALCTLNAKADGKPHHVEYFEQIIDEALADVNGIVDLPAEMDKRGLSG